MNRDTFLSTVSVLDTETTNLHPAQAEIVEIAGARYDGQRWQVSDMLFGAKNGIPPEASAKNHISNRMIEGLPTMLDAPDRAKDILGWTQTYLVAHNCKYDQDVLMYSWANAGSFEDAEIAADRSKWICTHRLSKQLLNVDFPDLQYNLSYLRYKLDLPVPDELGAHRAGADTITCALLFEFLVDYALATNQVTEGLDLGEQVHALCWKPLIVVTWPFGKNRGRPLSEIETDYYMWAMENMDALNEDKDGYDADLAASVAAELERRL